MTHTRTYTDEDLQRCICGHCRYEHVFSPMSALHMTEDGWKVDDAFHPCQECGTGKLRGRWCGDFERGQAVLI